MSERGVFKKNEERFFETRDTDIFEAPYTLGALGVALLAVTGIVVGAAEIVEVVTQVASVFN